MPNTDDLHGPVPSEAFSSGLLDKVHHERLLADLHTVVKTAGIPTKFIWAKLSEYCQGDDYKWVCHMRSLDSQGLCYTGKQKMSIEDKMMAITGAMLRNYIDARVMSLQDVLNKLKDNEMPTPTVLLIPNFCLDKEAGGSIPAWQVSMLIGMLIARMGKNCKTIIYVQSMATLEQNYGEVFRQHVSAHFDVV